MLDLKHKTVLVIGINSRARAVCGLLARLEARAVVADSAEAVPVPGVVAALEAQGFAVLPGQSEPPAGEFAAVVVCREGGLSRAARSRGMELVSELELGFQYTQCLALAVAGTNGRGTTSELIERMLVANQRRTRICGGLKVPVCAAAESSRELDYLIIKASPFQLESTRRFRPSIAVLTNLAPDDLDHFTSLEAYLRANARLFQNQQSFDWAIVQQEALASLQAIQAPLPAKIITFSATDPKADLHLDRGLLLSRLPDWEGPLLDLGQCALRGPHNAENLMAALAAGRVLRLPLERMVETLKAFDGGPHRCHLVAELSGVQFIDDSAARNSHALRQAVSTARPGFDNRPNVILIAGGRDRGIEYHDLGPLLSQRVKRAFLLGPAAEKMRAAWSLFTPCAEADSLLEAVFDAAKMAVPGDVVLLSPACSSADQSQDDKTRGSIFCEAVKSIDSGVRMTHHNITDKKPEHGVDA